MARTATLAPTKVEVEEAMQKAIFALIKVGELLSVCKYGGARGPGTKSSAKTKVNCGYASTRKRFDWSPKSQDSLGFTDQTVVYDSKRRPTQSRFGRLHICPHIFFNGPGTRRLKKDLLALTN